MNLDTFSIELSYNYVLSRYEASRSDREAVESMKTMDKHIVVYYDPFLQLKSILFSFMN